jgi:hypothetical protein
MLGWPQVARHRLLSTRFLPLSSGHLLLSLAFRVFGVLLSRLAMSFLLLSDFLGSMFHFLGPLGQLGLLGELELELGCLGREFCYLQKCKRSSLTGPLLKYCRLIAIARRTDEDTMKLLQIES